MKPSILLVTLALVSCISGCATYRTVTFRAPEVVIFDEEPSIADVAKVYYRTYYSAEVDSSRWGDGGISVFSDGGHLEWLGFMDIDSVKSGNGRVFTLLPRNVASIDSIYYGRNNIDRLFAHRWVNGKLDALVGDEACLTIHRFDPAAMDSVAVTFRRMNVRKTAMVIAGIVVGLLGIRLY